MFNKATSEGDIKGVETVIGPSVRVDGDFVGQGNVVVEGEVNGSLKTDGSLKVGSQAKISANIEAKDAIVGGEVIGNLKISGLLEITDKARITGDIECASLSMERGATFNGRCAMLKAIDKKTE